MLLNLNDVTRARDYVDQGALFVISHSGGKDSQAATIAVMEQVGIPADQVVLVHARLPGADWDGIEEHIRASHPELRLEACQAVWKDGSPKTFMGLVEQRGMWPSPTVRNCTSDLKRGPIEVVVRRVAAELGRKLIVMVDGRRAQESDDRKALPTWSLYGSKLTSAGRTVWTWLPIHHFTHDEVFATIAQAGQEPHPVYAKGMSRLSCAFCIMARHDDIRTAARLMPERFREYAAMERKLDQTFLMPKGKRLWLTDIVDEAELEQPVVEADADADADADYPVSRPVTELEKTPVYGLPINPRHLLEELEGGSFCVSYATRDRLGSQLDDAIRLVGEDGILLVDNGAFSMHKQGISARDEAYQEAYEAWAGDILARCPQAIAVIPDVIGGTEEENAQLIRESLLDWDRAMPIWHMHESIDYLMYLCESFSYVGIGSSGAYWKVGTADWHARMTEAFAAIDNWEATSNGAYIRPRIHLMRAQSMAHLYPVDSSDSTNVAMNHGRYRDEGEGYVARFAERASAKIEATSGAEAEHQEKRPLLDHLEVAAFKARLAAEAQELKDELELASEIAAFDELALALPHLAELGAGAVAVAEGRASGTVEVDAEELRPVVDAAPGAAHHQSGLVLGEAAPGVPAQMLDVATGPGLTPRRPAARHGSAVLARVLALVALGVRALHGRVQRHAPPAVAKAVSRALGSPCVHGSALGWGATVEVVHRIRRPPSAPVAAIADRTGGEASPSCPVDGVGVGVRAGHCTRVLWLVAELGAGRGLDLVSGAGADVAGVLGAGRARDREARMGRVRDRKALAGTGKALRRHLGATRRGEARHQRIFPARAGAGSSR